MEKINLINSYCEGLKRAEKSPKTIVAYRLKLVKFAEYLDNMGVDWFEVVPKTIKYYLDFLLIRKGQQATTRSGYYIAIRLFYQYLTDEQYIVANPALEVKAPKVERRVKDCITNEEITKLIHAPDLSTDRGRRDTALIALMAAVGLRVGAVTRLRISDIKEEEIVRPPKCPTCKQVDYAGESGLRGRREKMVLITLREKGGKSWTVPLNSKAVFYIEHYLTNRPETSEVVFLSRQGVDRPLTQERIYRLLQGYAKSAGITRKVSPHSFRHAVITWLLDCGVSEMVVKDFVGHNWLTTTEKYRHSSHRSFIFAGVGDERNLLEALDTPIDGIFKDGKG